MYLVQDWLERHGYRSDHTFSFNVNPDGIITRHYHHGAHETIPVGKLPEGYVRFCLGWEQLPRLRYIGTLAERGEMFKVQRSCNIRIKKVKQELFDAVDKTLAQPAEPTPTPG